jgi:hypothetical protein
VLGLRIVPFDADPVKQPAHGFHNKLKILQLKKKYFFSSKFELCLYLDLHEFLEGWRLFLYSERPLWPNYGKSLKLAREHPALQNSTYIPAIFSFFWGNGNAKQYITSLFSFLLGIFFSPKWIFFSPKWIPV